MNRLSQLFEHVKKSPAYKRKAARALVTADLRVLIANAEKSQKEIAEIIGISPAALSAKLSGEKNLTLDSIVDIAAAVNASFDIVFRLEDSPRAYQMWEADAHEDDKLDKADALLNEIAALKETIASMARASFRAKRGRQLTAGFETRTICANDSSEPFVMNGC